MEVGSSTDTYLSFFLSRPLWDVWNLFLLGLGRIVPIIALSPFLGGKILPDTIKIGFAVALVPLFLPFMMLQAHASIPLDLHFIFLLIKEILIGSVLGFLIAMPFNIAQGAGSLIDHQGGSQSLQVTDPSTQTQATPTGVIYNNMMIISFFSIGGPILFFNAVFSSYKVIPADQFFSPDFFLQNTPLFHTMIKLLTTLLTIVLQLSAPAVIAILLSDLFLGIANRMAPQVQISFLLWSMKSYVGIAILWVGWWFIIKQLDIQGLAWVQMIQRLVDKM